MLPGRKIFYQGLQGSSCPPQKKVWKTIEIRANIMLGKIKKIRADLLENRLNSGNFITILHKNSGKLSTAPLESIIPVRLCLHMYGRPLPPKIVKSLNGICIAKCEIWHNYIIII
jgi:hypothetical protein